MKLNMKINTYEDPFYWNNDITKEHLHFKVVSYYHTPLIYYANG